MLNFENLQLKIVEGNSLEIQRSQLTNDQKSLINDFITKDSHNLVPYTSFVIDIFTTLGKNIPNPSVIFTAVKNYVEMKTHDRLLDKRDEDEMNIKSPNDKISFIKRYSTLSDGIKYAFTPNNEWIKYGKELTYNILQNDKNTFVAKLNSLADLVYFGYESGWDIADPKEKGFLNGATWKSYVTGKHSYPIKTDIYYAVNKNVINEFSNKRLLIIFGEISKLPNFVPKQDEHGMYITNYTQIRGFNDKMLVSSEDYDGNLVQVNMRFVDTLLLDNKINLTLKDPLHNKLNKGKGIKQMQKFANLKSGIYF